MNSLLFLYSLDFMTEWQTGLGVRESKLLWIRFRDSSSLEPFAYILRVIKPGDNFPLSYQIFAYNPGCFSPEFLKNLFTLSIKFCLSLKRGGGVNYQLPNIISRSQHFGVPLLWCKTSAHVGKYLGLTELPGRDLRHG